MRVEASSNTANRSAPGLLRIVVTWGRATAGLWWTRRWRTRRTSAGLGDTLAQPRGTTLLQPSHSEHRNSLILNELAIHLFFQTETRYPPTLGLGLMNNYPEHYDILNICFNVTDEYCLKNIILRIYWYIVFIYACKMYGLICESMAYQN